MRNPLAVSPFSLLAEVFENGQQKSFGDHIFSVTEAFRLPPTAAIEHFYLCAMDLYAMDLHAAADGIGEIRYEALTCVSVRGEGSASHAGTSVSAGHRTLSTRGRPT